MVTARAEKCDNKEYIQWIGKCVIFIEYVVSLLLYMSIKPLLKCLHTDDIKTDKSGNR